MYITLMDSEIDTIMCMLDDIEDLCGLKPEELMLKEHIIALREKQHTNEIALNALKSVIKLDSETKRG